MEQVEQIQKRRGRPPKEKIPKTPLPRGRPKILTDEVAIENKRQSYLNWYLNHKDYYRQGGHGYELILKKTFCDVCNKEVTKIKQHSKRPCHLKRMRE